ncbi:hypothetical protein PGR6_39110 [Pseudomonas sp. GR 6-02]|nr:hypothetical protein PGR6_39110 [Pseudomonas sp. GR 6-02]
MGMARSMFLLFTVAKELAPAGARSGPTLYLKRGGLLRSPTGASSLATGMGKNQPETKMPGAMPGIF